MADEEAVPVLLNVWFDIQLLFNCSLLELGIQCYGYMLWQPAVPRDFLAHSHEMVCMICRQVDA